MADYIRSDQPALTISIDVPTESVRIQVTNPTPTGSRPAVSSNTVWRRPSSSTGNWTLVGTVGNNGAITDLFQRSATSFDYFARTDTYSESVKYTAATPTVTGLWLYAAADPGTLAHFPYTEGGNESLDVTESVLQFVGRTYPIVEAGVQETQTVATVVTVPFSDTDWRAQVEWWRLRKRERRTLLYRDGRGRSFACRIIGPVAIGATRTGATISVSLQRIDFTASTTEIGTEYSTAGANNDGGNGIYGNGLQGNGY